MKNLKKILSLLIIVLCVTLITTPLLAKGGSGGSGGSGGGSDGGGGFSGDQGGMSVQSETRQKTQEQSQLSVQQRTQIQACQGTAQQIRVRLREMARLTSGKALQAGELQRKRLTIRNEFLQLEEAQNQFTAGLSTQERTRLRNRLHAMKIDRNQIRTRLQDMENELALSNPDQAKLRLQIMEMEQAMERWQKQYTLLE